MGKKILLILGHPNPASFNGALAQAYKKGALQSGAEVREISVAELAFDPNLAFGYEKRTELEPCLVQAQESVKWAEHLVVVHPVWWGSMPALLKGFFDRVFLPGFAFQKRPNSLFWDRLLLGRTGRIICTMDQPTWFYTWFNGSPSHKALKSLTFKFCGIGPTRITAIGPVRLSSESFRAKWLQKVERLGLAQT